MSKLKIEKQIVDETLNVTLEGAIDEDADFKELQSLAQPKINFNFAKVSMLNSCGIREWVNFLDKLPANTLVNYSNCPQIIIEQINMVHGFFKRGSNIESFYAPYYCEKCGLEKKVLLKTQDIKNRHAPKMACPTCDTPNMEFDAIEEQYFNFLKHRDS